MIHTFRCQQLGILGKAHIVADADTNLAVLYTRSSSVQMSIKITADPSISGGFIRLEHGNNLACLSYRG